MVTRFRQSKVLLNYARQILETHIRTENCCSNFVIWTSEYAPAAKIFASAITKLLGQLNLVQRDRINYAAIKLS